MYINITMDPLIVVERSNEQDYYTGFEKTPFLTEGTEWMNKYTDDYFSNPRFAKVFVENLSGFSVFISKYLRP